MDLINKLKNDLFIKDEDLYYDEKKEFDSELYNMMQSKLKATRYVDGRNAGFRISRIFFIENMTEEHEKMIDLLNTKHIFDRAKYDREFKIALLIGFIKQERNSYEVTYDGFRFCKNRTVKVDNILHYPSYRTNNQKSSGYVESNQKNEKFNSLLKIEEKSILEIRIKAFVKEKIKEIEKIREVNKNLFNSKIEDEKEIEKSLLVLNDLYHTYRLNRNEKTIKEILKMIS